MEREPSQPVETLGFTAKDSPKRRIRAQHESSLTVTPTFPTRNDLDLLKTNNSSEICQRNEVTKLTTPCRGEEIEVGMLDAENRSSLEQKAKSRNQCGSQCQDQETQSVRQLAGSSV